MASPKPTLTVEVLLKEVPRSAETLKGIHDTVLKCLEERYASVKVGERITGYEFLELARNIETVVAADCVGLKDSTYAALADTQVEIYVYALHSAQNPGSRGRGTSEGRDSDEVVQARILQLPSSALRTEWDTLVFDNALPTRLLQTLIRMLDIMKDTRLDPNTFNWNRLCLLHGAPGSGKSTLCRALAQKLSIRLGRTFPKAIMFEINCNTMLSRFFGQSGKLIDTLFQRLTNISHSSDTLVCVIMDEVETIASHRTKSADGVDCRDGLRATNQLLTALDRLRALPNIIVLCTSNLTSELDSAFLDRVDKKILVPNLSACAIYTIFQSCLNELLKNDVIDKADTNAEGETVDACGVPSFNEMNILCNDPNSPGRRLWRLAQECQGFSGRLLRRLPILALAEYTTTRCSLQEAITALDAAVAEEISSSMLLMCESSGK